MTYQQNLPGVSTANHSNLGKEFERDLISTHSEYEIRRKAKIDRHPSEWEFIGRKEYEALLANPDTKPTVAITGNGYYMKRKATNVDFSGVFKLPGFPLGLGCSIKMDAKMSKGKAIPLGNFTKHQVDNLVSSARCGAVVGFMVFMYEVGRVFFCPASFVQKKMDKNIGNRRAAAGDGSISLTELEENAVEIPYVRRFVDWHPFLVEKLLSSTQK